MLLIVRNEVRQREAVVAGDEIHARVRPASAPFIKVARTTDPRGEFRGHAAIALPESADCVAILAVPLGPQDRKVTDLIATFAQIPRFGDELYLAEHGILMNDVKERAQLIDFVQFASE